MKRDGLDNADKNTKIIMSNILWLHDQPERLAILGELRAAMTPGQRARLNSPSTARQLVEKALRARSSPSPTPPRRETLREKLAAAQRQVAELTTKVTELTAGTRHAEFDLRRDTAREIAAAIAGNVSRHKVRDIVRFLTEGGRRR